MTYTKIFYLIVIVACVSSCKEKGNQEGIKLLGNVENFPATGFVHLEKITGEGVVKIDTLKANESGNFSSYVSIGEVAFYRLNFSDRQYVSLILTGDETEVTVNVHGNDPRGFSEVSGSYDTEYKNQMDALMKKYQERISQYQQQQIAARNVQDYQAFKEVSNTMVQLGVQTEKELKQLIWKATPSLAAVYGTQMIDLDKNYSFLDSVANEMLTEIPTNYHVQNLVNSLEIKRSLTIGSEAPDIALPNTEGEIVRLSSLRGNYVLIDFWAAWCRPCRAENPNVVRVYNKYADENFEIFGVSLDKTKNAWITAISQDGLPWLHVSDLKFWGSEAAQTYQVRAIPATYLIDPSGKIIAKNLRGASLEAKLKEIFG
ncbi:MAG: TlpA disulfide reductase family protein [Bacteroidota bacterium]